MHRYSTWLRIFALKMIDVHERSAHDLLSTCQKKLCGQGNNKGISSFKLFLKNFEKVEITREMRVNSADDQQSSDLRYFYSYID
jgi:hypothetical protein